eukprot:gene4930-6914_t
MDDFFEGQEKLLEVWFRPPNNEIQQGKHPKLSEAKGLRAIPRDNIQLILEKAKCCILDSYHNEYMDSYVLSESSLFITAYRLIIKTCGTTTLLTALPLIIKYAASVGLKDIDDIFFSRRELMSPDHQQYPHRRFSEEVDFLEQYFEGAAYPLGRLNGDRWYLYTLNNQLHITCPDVTLEIMMTSLDAKVMQQFYKSTATAKQVTTTSGIADIIPGAHIHEFLFDPCGYSCNAVINEFYFTIHITPQERFSYVSFETDYMMEDYTSLITKVLKVFRPGRFSLNLFANKHAPFGHASSAFKLDQLKTAGFRREDQQTCELEHASVLYGHFASLQISGAENTKSKQRFHYLIQQGLDLRSV